MCLCLHCKFGPLTSPFMIDIIHSIDHMIKQALHPCGSAGPASSHLCICRELQVSLPLNKIPAIALVKSRRNSPLKLLRFSLISKTMNVTSKLTTLKKILHLAYTLGNDSQSKPFEYRIPLIQHRFCGSLTLLQPVKISAKQCKTSSAGRTLHAPTMSKELGFPPAVDSI
jgi:hypothetical protein